MGATVTNPGTAYGRAAPINHLNPDPRDGESHLQLLDFHSISGSLLCFVGQWEAVTLNDRFCQHSYAFAARPMADYDCADDDRRLRTNKIKRAADTETVVVVTPYTGIRDQR